ncbi:MAG TPA: hypothetical protein VE261_08815 [Gaiellaceae bacterium]|nr:hypothetical protein [Gaiellaceae bacterium]
MRLAAAAAACTLLVSGAFAAPALAAGGDYVIEGGTPAEQAQVQAALGASSFDWSLVPITVTIHIERGLPGGSYSTYGQSWLDAGVLDTGRFSWGMVQMEYANQVQQTLVPPSLHDELAGLLGGKQWCYENPMLPPQDNACERFAALVAWAYWPSSDNCMAPAGNDAWATPISAPAFRAYLARTLAIPDTIDPAPQQRTTAPVSAAPPRAGHHAPRKGTASAKR